MSEIDGWDGLRPEIQSFALAMERRLQENGHKPGWKQELRGDLTRELFTAANHLWQYGGWGAQPNLMMDRAADVANYAMMIADVSGGLSAMTAQQKGDKQE